MVCFLWKLNLQDIERLKSSATDIASSLAEFSRCIRDTELPNDVTTSLHVLQSQTNEKDAIKVILILKFSKLIFKKTLLFQEDFRIAVRKGMCLLKTIRQIESTPHADQLSPTRLLVFFFSKDTWYYNWFQNWRHRIKML